MFGRFVPFKQSNCGPIPVPPPVKKERHGEKQAFRAEVPMVSGQFHVGGNAEMLSYSLKNIHLLKRVTHREIEWPTGAALKILEEARY